jgi:polysaccharide transporter, PST family
MTLIKTSFLNGIAVIIKIMTILGLNKILAYYVGPSGYAALGQFQNAVQMISTLGSGAITTGVTKYTAEYHELEDKQHVLWRTAGSISLISTAIIATSVILFNKSLASWFLKDERLGSIFIWFAATLVFLVFNTLLLGILNGKKEIQRYVIANITGSMFALLITTVMTIYMGFYGALLALVIYQSITFFVTLTLTIKASWFKMRYLLGGIDIQVARNLSKYIAMSLTSAACVPLSHIMIRNHLGDKFGWEIAGYWEAMTRLSAGYLMLVTTTLSVYYLPKLSELVGRDNIRNEIKQGYKTILPFAVGCGLLIYIFRKVIISILFTKEFLQMEVLFGWQMIGDTLKIGSWLLGYLLIAKALLSLYIISEIIFSLFFYLLVIFLSDIYGIKSTAVAHAVMYLCHFLFLFVVLKKKNYI